MEKTTTDIKSLIGKMKGTLDSYQEKLRWFEDNCYSEKAEDKFWLDQARWIEDKLGDVVWRVKYLSGEVIAKGHLYHNEAKRYCIDDDNYWTSGSTIEYWHEEYNEWFISSMEHNGNDYYIVALGRDKSPNGVLVRMRQRVW